MEEYMHEPNEKPTIGSTIVVFRGKTTQFVQMTETYWRLNYTYITKWCYQKEIETALSNLRKYVKAYNYYRDSVKDLIETEQDKKLVEILNVIYNNGTKIITDA